MNVLTYVHLVAWMHPLVLVGAAAGALLIGPSRVRWVALPALVFLGIGETLGLDRFGVHRLLLQAPGLSFLRYLHRAALYTGFGGALAIAAALECTRARVGKHVAMVLAAVFCLVVLGTRGVEFRDAPLTTFVDTPPGLASEIRKVVAAYGEGPLLELPWINPVGRAKPGGTEAPSMLLALDHGLPLVLGHTGYLPRHRPILTSLIPPGSENSLQRLVDVTGLRWILLEPLDRWPKRMRRQARALLELPDLVQRMSYEGWALFEVRRSPTDDRWIRAIRSGVAPEETALGTPLAPVPASGRRGSLSLRVDSSVTAGARLIASIDVENQGDVTWPGIPVRPGDQDPHLVRLLAQWRPIGGAVQGPALHAPSSTEIIDLNWDIRPGESHSVTRTLAAPEIPGRYELVVVLGQGSEVGQRFADVPSARHVVEVLPRGKDAATRSYGPGVQ